MTFKNDILTCLQKNIYVEYPIGNSAMANSRLMDFVTDLIEQFGSPQISDNTSSNVYYAWDLPSSKLSLRGSTYPAQKTVGISLFSPAEVYTYYVLSVNIKWEEKDVNQIKSQIPKNQNGKYTASGSGFVLSTNGIIATNYHVIEDATVIDVFINRNNITKKYAAKVLVSDKTNDISLIQIDDSAFTSLPAIPYAVKTSILDVGTNVFALGYPMSNILGEEIKVTDGIISSRTGYQGDIVTYQISAPIQPGNSGGPLFDKLGNLVGITNAGVPDAQNVGYAIKASYLRNLIDVSPVAITLPANNSISGLAFTEKIKRLSPYVVLIKIY